MLTGTIGTAYVHGLQTDDLRTGVAATAKHFLGYAMSEGGRNWNPVQMGRASCVKSMPNPSPPSSATPDWRRS